MDRVGKYLIPAAGRFGFYELSPPFLKKYGLDKYLQGIPLPLSKEAIGSDALSGDTLASLSVEDFALNMAFILGVDSAFKHASRYADFVMSVYKEETPAVLAGRGGEAADRREPLDAACFFRAALFFSPKHKAALYGYARTLMDLYRGAESEDYIGNLKAEAIETLELLVDEYPDFAKGWYYLGYMYLNMGLYMKARLAWLEYLKFAVVSKEREEIAKRLRELETPVEIEKGANAVISGKWEEGIGILEVHREAAADAWWPLHYYLGIAYKETGRLPDSEKAFKRALRLSPRNTDVMAELVDVYGALGDEPGREKYEKKIAFLKSQE